MGEQKPAGKPFDISKQEVWDAWLKVKANKGAPGVDEQSIEDFEADLKHNLYKVWNRMSSGSYFPPPVKAVEIPKAHGTGTRILGVPTIADRVSHTVVHAPGSSKPWPRFRNASSDTGPAGHSSRRSAKDGNAAGGTTGNRHLGIQQFRPPRSVGPDGRSGRRQYHGCRVVVAIQPESGLQLLAAFWRACEMARWRWIRLSAGVRCEGRAGRFRVTGVRLRAGARGRR